MFCALILLTLYLSVAACPHWLTGPREVTRGGGGGNKTTPLDTAPVTPGASDGGNSSGPSTSDPPPPHWGGPRDWTPYPVGGCLYAHSPRGRPGAR